MIDLNKLTQEEIEELENLELQKQYEMMSYADEITNDDAQYYGEQ
jgi:hypothetical protein